mgnify:CR=1 FL=1|jgi:glycosyltransferase involved in cell wall biosynthesis
MSMKVSVITVCYNTKKFILNTIELVNYQNIEHVFVDEKSSGNTLKIISENGQKNSVVISNIRPDLSISLLPPRQLL